jgi:hypothetical protein
MLFHFMISLHRMRKRALRYSGVAGPNSHLEDQTRNAVQQQSDPFLSHTQQIWQPPSLSGQVCNTSYAGGYTRPDTPRWRRSGTPRLRTRDLFQDSKSLRRSTPLGSLVVGRLRVSRHLYNTSVGTARKQEGQEDSLDDLEVTTLELLRTVFEVLFHSPLNLVRSVVLTLS